MDKTVNIGLTLSQILLNVFDQKRYILRQYLRTKSSQYTKRW
jgi:hypothetical protein